MVEELRSRPVMVIGALPVEIAGARRAIACRKELALGRARAWVGLAPGGGALSAGPRTAVAAAVGIGQRAVEASLERLFAEFPPAAVALVGLGGGCDPQARPGATIVCNPMLVEPERGPNDVPIADREPIRAHAAALEALLRAAAACSAKVRVAPSVTVNVVAASAAAKGSLGRNRGAAVCDMENFWAARFCARRGVPFAAARVVFDPVDEALPEIALPGASARAFFRRPWKLAALPRLAVRYLRVRRALDRLAGAIVRALAEIPA
jgi:nucleoside phosphorylase